MLTVYSTETSEIYGHGLRFVIWFSGCSLRCDGCINAHLWNKNSGKATSVGELMREIQANPKLRGVTFLGGEPLEQGRDLLKLCREITKAGLDIVLFSGYELSEQNEFQRKISDSAAVIISGRYDKTKRDTFLLHRGSRNQTITVNDKSLSSYYCDEYRQVEIEITATENKFLGFPDDFI